MRTQLADQPGPKDHITYGLFHPDHPRTILYGGGEKTRKALRRLAEHRSGKCPTTKKGAAKRAAKHW